MRVEAEGQCLILNSAGEAIHWGASLPQEDDVQLAKLTPPLHEAQLDIHVPKPLTGTFRAEGPALLSDGPVHMVLPAAITEVLDFTGRWCDEFRPQRAPLKAGTSVRRATSGRSGHADPPILYLLSEDAGEHSGDVWVVSLRCSGAYSLVLETDANGQTELKTMEPVALFHSSNGLNGAAQNIHRWMRGHLTRFEKPFRPVHYNCWEAVYFDHDIPTLKDIASRAAALGAERFVLDDGWFKGRNDDTSALGDWVVDTTKYPQGLSPLIEHLHAEGMGFGLWFEPEMINPDSDLFRAHPDWALRPYDVTGRNQLVLDMSREDVREYLFDRIDALLSEYPIEYIKWDHNRHILDATQEQGAGTYTLLDRLRSAHPNVEIESCASGGGRIDHGILSRTQRVWLSDSNDALERLRIQHEAALMISPEVTGSHVGPRICHTSGRILPMQFRAWVAAQRHMGFEMDPRELTDEEASILSRVSAWWKENRTWMFDGRLYRLNAPRGIIAEATVSQDQQQFVAFVGQETAAPAGSLRFVGLDPNARYRVKVANKEDVSERVRGRLKGGFWDAQSIDLTGASLMRVGIALPILFPETMLVLEGEQL